MADKEIVGFGAGGAAGSSKHFLEKNEVAMMMLVTRLNCFARRGVGKGRRLDTRTHARKDTHKQTNTQESSRGTRDQATAKRESVVMRHRRENAIMRHQRESAVMRRRRQGVVNCRCGRLCLARPTK